MASCKVYYMDVVTNTGSVRCIVVISEYVDALKLSNCNPASYTHLDVYKRQEYNSTVYYNNQSLSSCMVLGIDQYYFGTAGYQTMEGREILEEDSQKKRQVAVIDESVPVSYTHLDVYKRQACCFLIFIKHSI